MRQRISIWAVAGALCGASPVLAGAFSPPPGCTLNMTVQLHDCQVANHFTCEGDAPGEQWISYADGTGEFFISRIDAETRWIESISRDSGEIDRLDTVGSSDNASFSTLLASGRDEYDFVMRNNFGEVIRYVGHDQLTGESVTIDGVPLERCTFELSVEDTDGTPIATRHGSQFISRAHRVFFSDREIYQNAAGDSSSSFQAPVTFAFPGDEGFAESTPKFDCDMLMTGLSPLSAPSTF